MHSFRCQIIKYIINVVSQMLETIEPVLNSFISYFLLRSIVKERLDLGQGPL
ncbi:hypothetical protein HanRHA438_Chr13g0623901 [Helianthus annuus]|nr:hypothetical protein HanRHA438_Chr13g0623901 [Helianthus annuus]